jgi:hypothetical protein
MLHSVEWLLRTKVSGQLIRPIFKGQEVQEESLLSQLDDTWVLALSVNVNAGSRPTNRASVVYHRVTGRMSCL